MLWCTCHKLSFVADVGAYVSGEMVGTSKCFLTHKTLERFITGMNTLVTLQIAELTKRRVTYLTNMWLVTDVGAYVSGKVVGPSKHFVTHVTFERFVSRVNTLVLLQIAQLSK